MSSRQFAFYSPILQFMAGHPVHLSFWRHSRGWCYRFMGEGIVPLGPIRRTSDPHKIRDLAERGGGLDKAQERWTFDSAIQKGQGSLYLDLTDDQYEALTKPRPARTDE